MRKIDELIIHCTATREGVDFTADDIRRWHVRGNGWSDIGYHYVIRLDGTIEQGRPLERAGAHCLGHNQHSIGICYVGGLDESLQPKDTRTPAQKNALRYLLGRLRRLFPNATVCGHRDFAAKACPCFDARSEYQGIYH